MNFVKIGNITRPDQPFLRVRLCDTFMLRFRGLMLSAAVEPYGGILIDERSDSRINASIHMFFMNYDIAVVWVDSNLSVVDCTLARRWQPYYSPNRPARYILETHPERMTDFSPGDQVKITS